MHDGWPLRKVIVTPPREEYFKVENLKKHNIREIADRESAMRQHRALQRIMRNAGTQIIEVPELAGHPNSVFAMDTSLSLGDSFIKLRMGLPTRRGEEKWMAEILENSGLEKIGEVRAPGTAEGGDLLAAYPIFFIGLSIRTNKSGAEQLSQILQQWGYEVRKIQVPGIHLHLGGAMTIIGEDRILACKNIPRESLKGFEVIRIDCKSFITGNVIYLGNEKVIIEERNKEAYKKLSEAGYEIFPLNLSEFVKGSGGPSCLILPVKRG